MIIFRCSSIVLAIVLLGACSKETADEDARSDIRQLKDEVASLRRDLDEERAKSKRVMNVLEANLLRRASAPAPPLPAPSASEKALEAMERDRLDRRIKALEDDQFLQSQAVKR